MTAKSKAFLFLYGNGNLAGSLFALAMLGLFFAGIINQWWLPITVAAYVAGLLGFPADDNFEIKLHQENNLSDLMETVREIREVSSKKLPKEAIDLIGKICQTIENISSRLFDGSVNAEHRANIINAINRDLPITIANFVKLPAAYAAMHVIADGKTGKQIFIEQLSLLNEQLDGISESIFKNDAQALLANGRFLKEKFKASEFA